MRIVILHQHFRNPDEGGAIRSYYLARALISRGHEVIVFSGHNGPYAEQTISGIKVHWLPVNYENSFGFFKRGRSFLRFALEVIRHSKICRTAELTYAISVPLTTGLPALYLKRFFSIPYIFEIGDLWPDAPVEMGFVKNRLLKRSLYWLESIIYSHAIGLVSLSPAITAALKEKTPDKEIVTIPNLADTCFYTDTTNADRSDSGEDPLVISYFGALGFANGLEHMIQCAAECQNAGLSVRFVICGEGACAAELQRLASQLTLGNLRFFPLQNREGVRRLMNETDAVWVSYRPFPILETGSPNKYFDGLAAGKLILLNFGGWIREEVERERCGVYIDPGKSESILPIATQFIENRPVLRSYQHASRALAERKYSRKKLGSDFVDAVENAFNSASSR